MARLVKGCPLLWSQKEGSEKPETSPGVPQQEEQPDAEKGKVIVDCDLDVDHEGSEPKIESIAQEESKDNSYAEYANLDIPHERI